MTFTPQQRFDGGMATFERHGREHYSRISQGRPRRARFSERMAARPTRTASDFCTRVTEGTKGGGASQGLD